MTDMSMPELTLTVRLTWDPLAWYETYGVLADEQPGDVQLYMASHLQGSTAAEEAGLRVLGVTSPE